LCFTACKKKNDTPAPPVSAGTTKVDSTAVTKGTAEGSSEAGANNDDLIANSTFPTVVNIAFSVTGATITPATTTGVTITQTGGDVEIKSTATGVAYIVTGTTADGSIKIYSDKKYHLTLNNANITNLNGPAINIQSNKRAFLTLADGSVNTIVDGAVYATSTEDQKGTFFTEGQIIIGGTGTLNIVGNNKHGLAADDYVRVISGTINITKSISDGIHTNSAFIADGGTIKIVSGTDGIETEKGNIIINAGSINITSAGEGIKASYTGTDVAIVPYININGGNINITSTGGEGIASKNILTVNSGNIKVVTTDDAFNAELAIYINGGYIYAKSSANDAMDSNGTFTLTGGKVLAIGAGTPEGAIDCDDRAFKITGGELLGIAGATSGPTAASSTVRSVVLGNGTAQIIHIEAADGTEALTFQAPVAFSTLIFASGKLKANTTYNVWTGGSVSAASVLSSSTTGKNFNGWFTDGTYNRGTKTAATFVTTNIVTQAGGTISTK
ncbi:MAG: carbohydrate-binding domain-containing protein, partial [Bacteroidota bacterium]